MPAVRLDRSFDITGATQPSPLPGLLSTPAGLAIVEIQGTIHAPFTQDLSSTPSTCVGRLEFPLYKGDTGDNTNGLWMKKVYLYIGKHQRLTGEVKKLPKALVVLAKGTEDIPSSSNGLHSQEDNVGEHEKLNMLAIIKHKILFSSRPEPVGM